MSDRLLVVSGDCHADPARPEDFRPFVARKHHAAFDRWLQEMPGFNMEALFAGDHVEKRLTTSAFDGAADELDQHRENLATGLSHTADPKVRLRELEADGVVAEVIFPNGFPFSVAVADRIGEGELAIEGALAYNRWLASICVTDPGRHIGVAQIPPLDTPREMVDFIHWAHGAGLRALSCPNPRKGQPLLIDRAYDPVWEAAAGLNMPLHAHVGWGGLSADDISFDSVMTAAGRGVIMSESRWLSRRCLWMLIFSGAFERHPNLKLAFVEQQADWAPNQIAYLDGFYNDFQRGHVLRAELPHPPSWYWARNCFVTASAISRAEVEMRHGIGMGSLMFGSDYPHFEATWPNTKLWLGRVFEGVPDDEVRAIVGGSAVRCYGLDAPQLQAIADRIGPSLAEIRREAAQAAPAEMLQWLDERGISRPAICM